MFSNTKISTKLYLSFGILLAFLVALWGVGKWGFSSYQEAVTKTFRNDVKILEHASRARANALGLRRFEKDMFLNIDSAQSVEKYYKSWNDEKDRINARVAELEILVTQAENRQTVIEIKEKLAKYQAGIVKTHQRILAGEIKTPQEANQAVAEIKEATHKVVEKTQSLATESIKHVASEEEELNALAEKLARITLVISVAALFVGAFAALRITRSITTPLDLMRSAITQVETQHDFTIRIPVSGTDEVGEAALSFNKLLAATQHCLGQILGSVSKVSDAARGLSAASAQVAASSTQQSEATASMAAAIEELTAGVNHLSGSAHAARDISHKAGMLSAKGGEVIHKAVAEMSQTSATVSDASHTIAELGKQSNRISSIVQVIKEVADQTNLLALNAAIEAARAGEQGRGFAVVADEVRKLAERTSNATEEITQMISAMQHGSQDAVATMSNAVEQVSEGVTLANQAGSAIIEITDGANQVVNVVHEISVALAEQSSASSDISSQVEKVAQTTEENSAAAAQSAAAANNLLELADAMEVAVKQFKI